VPPGRVRRPGGGRKRTIDKDPTLLRDLEGLVEPTTSGAPDAPLRWTAKSTRHLARSLLTGTTPSIPSADDRSSIYCLTSP